MKSVFNVLVCIGVTVGSSGIGKPARPNPLMPQQTTLEVVDTSGVSYRGHRVKHLKKSRHHLRATANYSPESQTGSRKTIGYGFEVGTLMNRSNLNSDLLGMQLFLGLRAFARIEINPYFYVKPSLGYFRRSSGEASASLTDNWFEGGVSLLYSPSPFHSTIFLIGLAQRVDAISTKISALGTTATSPFDLRYRAGPQVELSSALSRSMDFIADFEFTVTATQPMHPYGGLSIGLMFK